MTKTTIISHPRLQDRIDKEDAGIEGRQMRLKDTIDVPMISVRRHMAAKGA